MNILQIGLTKFEQNLYEFKLAIIYIVDDINITLSHLKEGWFYLEPLFFFNIRNLGERLISMHNRPAQLGRFLVQWANWGLDLKVNSLTRKQFISTNYTQKEWGDYWSKIRYNLTKYNLNIIYLNYVKSKPRFIPVIFPLPVSSSLLFPGSLKALFTSVYFYMKSEPNLIKLYNTMKTLGNNVYYLPIRIQGCTVGVNLTKNTLGFQLSCKGREFKIELRSKYLAKYSSLYNGGLNKDILNKDRLLELTDPGRCGYNPKVFMQQGLNYNQANFSQDESSIVSGTGEPSNLNRGTKRTRGNIGNESDETALTTKKKKNYLSNSNIPETEKIADTSELNNINDRDSHSINTQLDITELEKTNGEFDNNKIRSKLIKIIDSEKKLISRNGKKN